METITIDPGFKYTGITWWSDNGILLNSTRIEQRPRNDKELFAQYKSHVLRQYHYVAHDLLNSPRGIARFVVERMPFHNASTQRILTISLLGALEFFALEYNIQWVEVSAIEVKKFTTGNSKATKAQMRRAIMKLYPEIVRERKVTEIPFDEIDSIAIGHMYFNRNKDDTKEKIAAS